MKYLEREQMITITNLSCIYVFFETVIYIDGLLPCKFISSYLLFLLFLSVFFLSHRVLALKATVFADGKVEFTTKIAGQSNGGSSNDCSEVLFIKRKFDPINPENIYNLVEVTSMHGAPIESLFNTLRGIWCPTLLQSSDSTSLPPRVQQLLAELEESLNSSIRANSSSNTDMQNTADIYDINDEIRFWQSIQNDRRSSDKNLAKDIMSYLDELQG